MSTSQLFTRLFWRDVLERSVKSFAGGMLSFLTVAGVTVIHVEWVPALASGATAALVSVLMSLVSLPVAGNGTASLVRGIIASRGRHAAPD